MTTSSLSLHKADALEWIETIPAGSVSCIVTDPAYESLNKWRSIGTTTRLGGNRDEEKRSGWFDTVSNEDLFLLLCQFARVLPKSGHAWIMADGETLPYLLNYIREGETGFGYCKSYPVMKLTADGGNYRQGMGYHGRGAHEYVVLCEKGRRRFTDENWADVFALPWRGDAETKPYTPDGKPYPTAKPWMLFREWISLSTVAGETVLDPFVGGGASAFAALCLGRKFIGVDKSEYALETTRCRCSAVLNGQENEHDDTFTQEGKAAAPPRLLPSMQQKASPVLDL